MHNAEHERLKVAEKDQYLVDSILMALLDIEMVEYSEQAELQRLMDIVQIRAVQLLELGYEHEALQEFAKGII